MKTIKVILFAGWVIGFLMLGLGLAIYFSPGYNPMEFNRVFLNRIVLIVATIFVMITPIMLATILKDTLWKKQKEIDDVRIKLYEAKEAYVSVSNKLISETIQLVNMREKLNKRLEELNEKYKMIEKEERV